MNLGNQITLIKAKISERENALMRILKRGENLFILLREQLDPTADDITCLDLESAGLAMEDLREAKAAAIEIKAEIAKLKKEIGEA